MFNLMFASFLVITLVILGHYSIAGELGLIISFWITITQIFSSNMRSIVVSEQNKNYALMTLVYRSTFSIMALVSFYYFSSTFISFEQQKLINIISLLIITLLALVPQIRDGFNIEEFMKSIMGYFFVIFSLFKLLNIKGFATLFSNYDLIASRLPIYGTIYPFIELTLGICFLANFGLLYVNVLTLIVMSVGSIGIGNSLKRKEQLECACLGSSFNLPLTPITLIENLIMAAMALYMIIKLI